MTAGLPDWTIPPRPSGWEADDLDRLPRVPRRTELIDGALILMLSPQRFWHARLVENMTFTLGHEAPAGFEAERETTVRLDRKSRPEPDILVSAAACGPDRTCVARAWPGAPGPFSEVRDAKHAVRSRTPLDLWFLGTVPR